jgi:hypothetical protein
MLDADAGGGGPLTPTMNRVLSAAQHMSALTSENGGATMDLRGMKAYEAGQDVQMVGGSPDVRTGKAFPTQLVDVGSSNPRVHAGDVIDARKKMLPAAVGKASPALGTWAPEGKRKVDIDLVDVIHGNPKRAGDLTIERNEDAYFNLKNFDEPSNEQLRTERGIKGSRPPKGAKQEEVARRHKG